MNISARHALCQPMAICQKQRAASLPRGSYPRWASVGAINARPSLLSHSSSAGSFATPSVKQPSPARSTRLVTHASSSNLFPGGRQQAKVLHSICLSSPIRNAERNPTNAFAIGCWKIAWKRDHHGSTCPDSSFLTHPGKASSSGHRGICG